MADIELFRAGDSGPSVFSAGHMNKIVKRVNALCNIKIKSGAFHDAVTTDSNILLTIGRDEVTGGGSGTNGSGLGAGDFLLAAVQDDYVDAYPGTWRIVNVSGTAVTKVSGDDFAVSPSGYVAFGNDEVFAISSVNSATSITLAGSAGTRSGINMWSGESAYVHVLKEQNARTSMAANTIAGVDHTYTYAAGADSYNVIRTNSDGIRSVDEVLLPPYRGGEMIHATPSEGGLIEGGGSIDWLLVRSAQWSKLAPASMYLLVSVQDDYVTAHTWDGTTEGSDDILIAKPWKIRASLASETIFGTTHNYSYNTGPDGDNKIRTNNDGSNAEDEIITPPWTPGEVIFAIGVTTDAVDGDDNPIELMLIARDAQWAKLSPLAVTPQTPSSSSDTTNGYGAGLITCDGSYLYASVGVDSWKRAALSSF